MADAGANTNAFDAKDEGALDEVVKTPVSGLTLQVANGGKLQAYAKGVMRIMSHLPAGQRIAHLFQNLKSGSLVAVGKFAQLGSVVTFNKAGVKVIREDTGEVVLQGPYDPERGLYYVDLSPSSLPPAQETAKAANEGMTEQPSADAQAFAIWEEDDAEEPFAIASANLAITHTGEAARVRFWHKVFGSPVLSTFIAAIDKGYLSGVPGGLTAALVRKHDPTSLPTVLGHMARTRQGQNSTKKTAVSKAGEAANSGVAENDRTPAGTEKESDTDWIPVVSTRGDKQSTRGHLLFKIVQKPTGRNHMDASGRFPIESEQGNEYLMIFVCEDSNYIHFEAMKNRTAAEQTAAFRRGYEFYKQYGFAPKIERLDNEKSQKLLDEMQKICGVEVELVPSNNHRALKAERQMRTAKDHLISVWATASPEFPMRMWDHTEQPEKVLNMMRGSNINPRISAYEQLRGAYNWSKYPLAPFGMRICAYEAPETRSTFGQRCAKGFLLGCSELHHRSWRVVIEKGGIRVSDTLAWIPNDFVMPGATPTERLETALKEVVRCSKELRADLRRGQDGSGRGVSQPNELLTSIDELASLYLPPPAEARTEEHAQRGCQQLRVPGTISAQQQPEPGDRRAVETQRAPAAAVERAEPAADSSGAQRTTCQQLRVPGTSSAQQPEPGDREAAKTQRAPAAAVEAAEPAAAVSSGATPVKPTAAAELHPTAEQNGGAKEVRFADILGNKKRRAAKATAKSAGTLQQIHAAAGQAPAATAILAPLRQAPANDAAEQPQPKQPKQQRQKLRSSPRDEPQESRRQQCINLPRGRSLNARGKRATRRAKYSSQPEYVLATAEELQRYTARQLKDLMRDHEISGAKCLTREDLVEAIIAAKVDVRHKLSARETLAHVRAATAGARASKEQKRRLAMAERVHAVAASAACAAVTSEEPTADGEAALGLGGAFAYATTNETTGETLVWRRLVRPENPDQVRWILATDQEWDRLIEETGTLEFIDPDQKEPGRTASYMSMAASLKPDSAGDLTVPRVRGAYGGNVTDYTGPRSANTASHAAVKTLLNAIVSDPKAQCMTADAKDFYLMTDLDKFEYMWIERGQIPERTFLKYGLESRKTSSKGQYMVRVKKGMYGLPHAGRIAAIKVTALLATAGYHECRHNKMVFRHETRDVTFTLVVDDFLVKYSERADAEHLIETLETVYKMKTDWEAKKYLGITLQWDYVSEPRTVTLSMPNYVEKGVKKFSQWLGTARKVSHGPGFPAPRVYGVQPAAKEVEHSPDLPDDEKTELQRLVGYFRYYAEAIDSTQLVKLGQLASQQNRPTEATKKEAAMFLDYVATWPNATLVYRASDMVLRSISDGSHRGEPQGGSRVGGIHFYGSKTNGAVQIVCKLLDVQSSSACETELGALYENGRVIAGLRTMASEFGYVQEQPTEVECDNKCAVGIACETEKQKRAAAMDMRFLWVADRVRQGQIRVSWSKGEGNLADYVTKIHSHKHHREMRKLFVCDPSMNRQARSA